MPRKPSIQKLIQDLEPNELREVIKELCNLDPKNKQFLTLYLQNSQSSDIDGVIEEAKKRIYNHLYGRSIFPKCDLAGARKTVVEYTKILKDYPILAADLKLYYVETGTEIINDFGDMYEGFYSSMESMFHSFCNDMKKHPTGFNSYKERVHLLLDNCRGIGWGYTDMIDDYAYDLYDFLENIE